MLQWLDGARVPLKYPIICIPQTLNSPIFVLTKSFIVLASGLADL